MSRNHIDREIRKLADDLYIQALASGEHFTPEELAERLAEELRQRYADEERGVVDDLIVSAAYSAMQSVDQAHTRPDAQQSLFDDLDRSIPVAESKRIARRWMRQDDWSAHLAHVSANASRIAAAAAKEYTRHTALSPYLSTGVTTEEALRQWQQDHPEEVLP